MFIAAIIMSMLQTMLLAQLPALAVSPPSFSAANGSFTSPVSVTVTASTGTIYYTEDGSTPTNTSTSIASGSSVTISSPTQLNAVAYSSGTYSAVTTAFYDVDANLGAVLSTTPILRLTAGFGVVTSPLGSLPPLTKWTDLSGAGNDATAASGTQPVLLTNAVNGLPAVGFNGITQFLTLPASSSFTSFGSGLTIFAVINPSTPTANARLLDLGNGLNSNNIFISEPSSGSVAFHIFDGVGAGYDSSISATSALTVGQYQVLSAQYTGSASANLNTNQTQVATGTVNNPVSVTRSSNFIGQASGSGNFFSGGLAELLAYPASLSQMQIAEITGYLMQKYQALSPPATPLISAPTSVLTMPTQVMISCDPEATTYYTTDGSIPSPGNSVTKVYCGVPITINYQQTVNALSIKNGMQSSAVPAAYTMNSTLWPQPSSGDTSAPVINLTLPTPSM